MVDDDDANRQVAHEVLTDAGFRVRALANATDLAQAIADEAPSLVILDGGLSAMAKAHLLPHTPVIVVSAAYGAQIDAYASAIDARAWLRKPFDIDELVALVRQHVPRV